MLDVPEITDKIDPCQRKLEIKNQLDPEGLARQQIFPLPRKVWGPTRHKSLNVEAVPIPQGLKRKNIGHDRTTRVELFTTRVELFNNAISAVVDQKKCYDYDFFKCCSYWNLKWIVDHIVDAYPKVTRIRVE